MKRFLCLILSICLMVTFTSCGKLAELFTSSSSSSSTTVSSSTVSSSATSSSGSLSGADGLLYPEYDEKYEYLDMFSEQILAYQNDSEKVGYCRIHFIDVGQGDCMLIELPDGKLMVIDAGDRSSDVEEKIEQKFESLAVDEIDYLIATHQDADHIGNMDAVFDNYDVHKVYRPYVLSKHENASTLPL